MSVEPVTHTRPLTYLHKVEDAIIDALKTGIDGSVKVENFPAEPETYDFAGLNSAVLVHYIGSNYKGREGQTTLNQVRRLNFSIVLLVHNLRDGGGAYHTLEDIRLALQGQSFEGADPAEIVSDGLKKEYQGQWRWEIVIGLGAPAVARNPKHPAPLMRPVTQTPPVTG